MRFLYILFLFFSVNFFNAQTPFTSEIRPKDSLVYDIVDDVEPEFPGGYDKLLEYISKEIQYPEFEKSIPAQLFQGKNKLIVKFMVEKDGSVSQVQIDKSSYPCPLCEKEAIRVIQQMPKWKPANNNGKLERCWVRVPIIFDLESER
jgi:protein TonB